MADINYWWIYLVYLSTLAPWAVMQVFDAIDAERRYVQEIPKRLAVSFFLVTASTTVGLRYVVWSDTRVRTEAATMLLSVVLNGWHWLRNFRGWDSYRILLSQKGRVCELMRRLMVMRLQGMVDGANEPDQWDEATTLKDWEAQWNSLWINNTVIDNDPRKAPEAFQSRDGNTVLAGDVLWRMFWLQGVVGEPLKDEGARIDAEAALATAFEAGDPPSHGERALIEEEALDRCIREHIGDSNKEKSVPLLRALLSEMSRADQESLREQAREHSREAQSRWVPPTGEERRRSLAGYDVGQQDIGGRPLLIESFPPNLQSLWRALSWVTASAPRPMENIWYDSSALVDTLHKHCIPDITSLNNTTSWPRFPIVAEWYRIAGDLASMRQVPLLLSVQEGKGYALRLASVSALLAYHFIAYTDLCKEVHLLGIKARWTHGWSGLVACYSKYWTLGNVCVALLGGLPLLVITGDGVGNPCVKCLLVGLASENIMSTYLSDARRAARTKELERRYLLNKGKTCRGSGVRCIRDALEALNLPRLSSQLDGSVAFATGWAMEAVQGLPGNQAPRDGNDHGQIEDLFCSSRAYRFPDERL